ncbi:MAG: ABC transporter permease [Desulfobacterales bacterium]|nr:MAG: ABC transporter permease [Desulfobacterales bacterium]
MKVSTGTVRFLKSSEFYLFLVIAGLGAILTVVTEDFFSLENLFDVLVSYSFLGIMAVGLMVVLISGGIDISFTATATVAQYIMASFIIQHGGGWWVAFLIPVTIGIMLGAVNAALVYNLRVHSIIITIATLNVFYGVLIFVTRGKWIYNFPDWFAEGYSLFDFSAADGTDYSFSLSIIVLLAVFAVTGFLLNRTSIGRQIYAMGGNMDAAKRMGFNLLKLHFFVYCYMGFLAGIAGLVQAQLVQTVAPNSIVGRELEVVAAVVLGGASLAGGAGTLLGTILGVTLIAIMQNGLTLLGVSSYWHKIVIGMIILISVSITAYNRKLEERRHAEIDV